MAKRNHKAARWTALALGLALGGCTAETASQDGGAPDASQHDDDAAIADGPSWNDDIHPLLVASCGGCHAGQAPTAGPPMPGRPGGIEGGAGPGAFGLDDADAAYAAIAPYVSAGDPEASVLYIKISEDMPSSGGQRMPPALRQWDDASIAAVRDWIAAGAQQN